MAIVKPFRALRPHPAQAAQVSAVPYDVVNIEEALHLASDNPLSFLRVSRPEIELSAGPNGMDVYADAVYARAASNFQRLIEQAPLITEAEPSFYIYRLKMGERTQTGLVACCAVDEYDSDIILKHERTRKDKEDDRTRHILTLRAQTGPVFTTYRADATVNTLTEASTASAPLFDFVAADGVAHTIWLVPVEQNAAFVNAFAEVPKLYIADGHHRAKSASRAREELKQQNPQHNGQEEYNFFQCVLFPADQLQILAYNRAVKDLNSYSVQEFLNEVAGSFEITPDATPVPAKQARFAMYLNGRWYGLKLRNDITRSFDITDQLDVSVLQNHLLAPVLAVQDPRTDKRIDFIGGIRGAAELERLVNEGQAAVAFSLFPTTLDDLMNVSDAGEIMPPKSTWFEPKLRDGLLSHLI
ncbi:MAG: DUF1015 domain-containing protein [Acidobacteria bacterium]|nr:DUF1015 domain-containing protein [Acidobacteriota bacterium]MBI3422725.1 DUF1015 domain-containing protein [Acidobacteriota bacterium]